MRRRSRLGTVNLVPATGLRRHTGVGSRVG
jgi:hypothetical protein